MGIGQIRIHFGHFRETMLVVVTKIIVLQPLLSVCCKSTSYCTWICTFGNNMCTIIFFMKGQVVNLKSGVGYHRQALYLQFSICTILSGSLLFFLDILI